MINQTKKLILFLACLASSSILLLLPRTTHAFMNSNIISSRRPSCNNNYKHSHSKSNPSSSKHYNFDDTNNSRHLDYSNNNGNDNIGGDRIGGRNNGGGSGGGGGGGSGGGGGDGDYFGQGGFNDPYFLLSSLPFAFTQKFKRDVKQQTLSTLSKTTTNLFASSSSSSASSPYSTSSFPKRTIQQILMNRIRFCFDNMQYTTSKHFKFKNPTEYITWYMNQIEKNPLLVKSLSSGIISACGDFVAQTVEHKNAKKNHQHHHHQHHHHGSDKITNPITYDKRRLWACFADGMFIAGPIMHFGYNWFESILPVHNTACGKSSSIAAAAQVLADTVMLDSIFVATKIVSTGLLEGLSFHNDILPQFKNDYWNTVRASWVTSTGLFPVDFACFRFLPCSLRAFSMSVTGIIWDSVVTYKAHESRL